ncbi:hypothetical protein GmHk_20G056969 [Glycine max]|nr:hypothetical protein GmHk_20G056969 [Glycine max]
MVMRKKLFSAEDRQHWHVDNGQLQLLLRIVSIWSLNGVASLLHLPIIMTTQEAVDKIEQFRGAYIRLAWLRYIYHTKCHARQWTLAVRVYSLNLVGCTLFANKSVTHTSVVFLDELRDLNQSRGFSWEAAALSWIYEHFPSIGNMIANEDYHESKPHACRWKCEKALSVTTYHKRLDRLMENVLRQFGYVQSIPPLPGDYSSPSLSTEDIDDRWLHFSQYLALIEEFVTFLVNVLQAIWSDFI